jgi:hypothetical protein
VTSGATTASSGRSATPTAHTYRVDCQLNRLAQLKVTSVMF